jgi:hypothetical protein
MKSLVASMVVGSCVSDALREPSNGKGGGQSELWLRCLIPARGLTGTALGIRPLGRVGENATSHLVSSGSSVRGHSPPQTTAGEQDNLPNEPGVRVSAKFGGRVYGVNVPAAERLRRNGALGAVSFFAAESSNVLSDSLGTELARGGAHFGWMIVACD